MPKTRRLDQLSKKEFNDLISSPQGLDRVIKLEEKTVIELKKQTHHVWQQIKDKEEVAGRWLNTLIVLSLLQLFPFQQSEYGRHFLMLTLPTFIISFYSTALVLFKHPNYNRPDFFISESEDKKTRLQASQAEIKALQDINQSLTRNYERKRKFAGYIGPSVMVNFSLSILFLTSQYVFEIILPEPIVFIGAILSVMSVYFLKKRGQKESFTVVYQQYESGGHTLVKG